jgi:hypothetical protein
MPCLNSFGEHLAAKRRLLLLDVEICVFSLPARRLVAAVRKRSSYYGELEVGQYSVVGIATRYGLDGPGIETRWGANFSETLQTVPEAQAASYTMGTGSFPRVKRPRLCVDHPPHLEPRLKEE